ncbi:winged helix-turn-helix transcriptional regulator [Candidatus Pacearchaeota archaeon]|nr:winged helix-turn-helix transcriptional regulator [Candidatus Pacearchaeota archaeon]
MINKSILKHAHHEGFSEEELYNSYKIFFGTFVSESRLKIINLLRKSKKNVSEIIEELKMDQTAVSHDLARLKQCGFVNSQIDGKYRYYELNKKTIKPLMEMIEKHMSQYCIHILHTMKGGIQNEKR